MESNKLINNLLDWYDQNKRDLPWRLTKDPYSIWISEIMAQQTRITALLPYYKRFIDLFPTVKDLAESKEDDVLKAWEGLGYYSRARNLRKAANLVMSEFGGSIPHTEKELKSLPGIGEYTAGAVLSIAFDQKIPAVDGNVLRVFARVENNPVDVMTAGAKILAGQWVLAHMPAERTGAFTQALMELGALVCIPKSPACDQCPIAGQCTANAIGNQKQLPIKAPKKAQRPMSKLILLLINENGQVLMRQRTESLLKGLWEFYMVEDSVEQEGEIRPIVEALGLDLMTVEALGEKQHVFTHIVWNMNGFKCRVKTGSRGHTVPTVLSDQGYTWVAIDKVSSLAIATAIQFYAKQVR